MWCDYISIISLSLSALSFLFTLTQFIYTHKSVFLTTDILESLSVRDDKQKN